MYPYMINLSIQLLHLNDFFEDPINLAFSTLFCISFWPPFFDFFFFFFLNNNLKENMFKAKNQAW